MSCIIADLSPTQPTLEWVGSETTVKTPSVKDESGRLKGCDIRTKEGTQVHLRKRTSTVKLTHYLHLDTGGLSWFLSTDSIDNISVRDKL